MDENINKSINRIEGRILELVTYMDKFLDTLKELVPKAIEKEVVLKNGQIYRFNTSSKTKTYYLLQGDYQTWSLLNLDSRNTYWIKSQSYHITQNAIERDFIFCPDAIITVLTFDKGV